MSKIPVSVKNKNLTPVKKDVKKHELCILTVSKNCFDRQGVKNGIKKHVLRFLMGVKKGCQKTLYKYKYFFLTPYGRSQCDVSCAFTFAQRQLTRYALTKDKNDR